MGKKRDEERFINVVQAFRHDLYKTAYAFLKSEEAALEAVQEVTFRAFKKRKQLRETQYTKTWLIRIMINYCQDVLRKNARFVQTVYEDNDREADFSEQLLLDWAIQELDSKEQTLIFLKYFHGYTYTELSHYYGVAEGTLKSRIHVCLEKLRQTLSEKGGYQNGS
ncbi:RNA polymerase sigma factor [Alkalibacillus haloalkaliphilus]|uniref:RNA polymerase subunit sigma-24 n=1 Tax=Alkalibacillus haloalkaliphilus TaxID=94136 RepID=A0A511W2P0_9BACI|nr:sigma-70 family RNA polymerase sigma factor [Alkalibacillus haloalkaliphilus]GEN45346.1 RNA polymerase subunit sigma-24 [Alkalibacillus haloalkaliphilus]